MFEYAKTYGLLNKIKLCMLNNDFGTVGSWKRLVKDIIWRSEEVKWKTTCTMYKGLNVYRETVNKIEMHPWWMLEKLKPHLFKMISCLMAVLCGGQPAKKQSNFVSRLCKLCHLRARETPEHILFICPALEFNRSQLIMYTTNAMPNTMTEEFAQYNIATKLSFLLSGLRSKFTPEWENVYLSVLRFVWEIYETRKQLYDAMFLDSIDQ